MPSSHSYIFQFFCLHAVGDGREGYPDMAPYDAIHVGAAAPHIPQAVSLYDKVLGGLLACMLRNADVLRGASVFRSITYSHTAISSTP